MTVSANVPVHRKPAGPRDAGVYEFGIGSQFGGHFFLLFFEVFLVVLLIALLLVFFVFLAFVWPNGPFVPFLSPLSVVAADVPFVPFCVPFPGMDVVDASACGADFD